MRLDGGGTGPRIADHVRAELAIREAMYAEAAALRDYERFAGAAIDQGRVLYHRVFVSTRVVVIRHRNIMGEPAHAIVSRALNRRLLTEALAEASGHAVSLPAPLDLPPTPHTALYDHMLADLRDVVVGRSTDSQVIAKAKDAAKVVKYLQAYDRYGDAPAHAERDALCVMLGRPDAGEPELAAAIQDGRIAFPVLLGYFAGQAARQGQFAAAASGGIAHRRYLAF